MKKALGLITCFFALSAEAITIDFEDLTTRNNFRDQGIINTYQGFEWGYGTTAGLAGRTFVDSQTGWASATANQEAFNPEPNNLGGTSYAWNWNGAQSLWIDFRSLTDFNSGDFAILSTSYGLNASTIQFFGYDGGSNLVDSSAVFNLTDTFTTLNADFTDIQYLEIRAENNFRWFSIDNLVIDESAAPVSEPGTLALLGLGLAGLGFTRRRSA